MYRELQPLRRTLSEELRSSLLPGLPGIQPDKLIDTYLDQLTLFVGADVADLTLSLLAIAKSITGAHGGRSEVESEFGWGTTFAVVLPAA